MEEVEEETETGNEEDLVSKFMTKVLNFQWRKLVGFEWGTCIFNYIHKEHFFRINFLGRQKNVSGVTQEHDLTILHDLTN